MIFYNGVSKYHHNPKILNKKHINKETNNNINQRIKKKNRG